MKKDELKLDRYRFTIRPMTREEGKGYLIEFPDVPFCLSDGETVEEAIANGRDALRGTLLCYQQDGKPIPQPDSGGESTASGQFRVRMPKSLHARLARQAEIEGVSLNTIVVTAAAESLGRREAVVPQKPAKQDKKNRKKRAVAA